MKITGAAMKHDARHLSDTFKVPMTSKLTRRLRPVGAGFYCSTRAFQPAAHEAILCSPRSQMLPHICRINELMKPEYTILVHLILCCS